MDGGESRRFTNDNAGHKAFMDWLGQPETIQGARIVYEPTGPYHRAFERRLAAAGFALVKVNPRQARRFAEATGRLAKTDRLDAAMLARMEALLDLEARPVRSPILNDLKDLHMAREALVKNRTAAKNRAKNLTLAILKRHNAEQLRQIERQMEAIETEIMALIKAEPDLSRRFDILVSIPGVSAITAFALLIDMPELGTLGQGQGGFTRRPRSRRTTVREMDRPRLHSRRSGQRPAGALHAGPRRHALQPLPQGKVRSAQGCRKSRKSRHHCHHETASRARKRPAQGWQKLAPIPSLTNTDTLVAGARPGRLQPPSGRVCQPSRPGR